MTSIEEVILFKSRNGGYCIELVGQLRLVGNVRYYLTYDYAESPTFASRYDPLDRDFKELGLLDLRLS